ncbi:MAG: hypothetical protein ACR2G5_09490 [Pyrinomonadaceae bacterium]
MVKRLSQRQLLATKLDSLDDSEVRELLNHIAMIESMRQSKSKLSSAEDEVVALLAEARENRRAQQAFEWEAARRRAERQAVAKHSV